MWAVPLMGLPAAVAAMQVTLAQHTATLADLTIAAAQAQNASATMRGHPLKRIPLVGGGALPIVVWFPATRGELEGPQLTNARADALLAAYGLPAMPGTNAAALDSKRRAIALHIGVRML